MSKGTHFGVGRLERINLVLLALEVARGPVALRHLESLIGCNAKAVYEAITALRRKGYQIETRHRFGYVLRHKYGALVILGPPQEKEKAGLDVVKQDVQHCGKLASTSAAAALRGQISG